VSDREALDAFLGKWRERWPEWRIAEAFLPAPRREATLAWLALRQELADAAWQGADPRPGAAKLAWWSDELRGWAQGRRRHPLGLALQREPAPWEALGLAVPALAALREAPHADAADAALAPFAAAAVACSAAIAGEPAPAEAAAQRDGALAAGLRAMRALAATPAASPLPAGPRHRAGTRADRIFAALAHERLRAQAAGRAAASPWRTLWAAWRAGRSIPRA